MSERIYLSPPYMCGKELAYIQQAFQENWVAPLGPNVTAFEQEMAAYIGADHALATNAGTGAMHLALRYLGAGPGDLVFCSDLTFAGSCNPILYQNATPVFIDSEPESHNMSPIALAEAFRYAEKLGKRPKAVIIVDIYGQSADYDALLPICRHYDAPVIEDAAEAVGAGYKGKRCGSFGEFNILSFNGNKIVTTSGGGMVLSNDEQAIQKMLFWATQAREPALHYEHKEYGYNYRLSNICAGIGRGQLEGLPQKLERRKAIYETYARLFADTGITMLPISPNGEPNYWLSLIRLPDNGPSPGAACNALNENNIEARPAWKPMHMQPVFRDCPYFSHAGRDVGADLFQTGLCLPSGEALSPSQQELVVSIIKQLL